MKKIAILIVFLIAVGTAIFFIYTQFYDADSSVNNDKASPSQVDTKVDTVSQKDTFEYFLSGIGELTLPQLKSRFTAFNSSRSPEERIDERLFEQYIKYKQYLQGIDGSAEQFDLGLSDLQDIDSQLKDAQGLFFTSEEQDVLFAEDNHLREIMIKQLTLQEQVGSDEEFDVLWEQELSNMSEEAQETYRNGNLLKSLYEADKLAEQARELKQEALVGAEISQRLNTLKKQQRDFNSDVSLYMEARNIILFDKSLDEEGKLAAVDELRQFRFSSSEQKRVKGLEVIYDNKK